MTVVRKRLLLGGWSGLRSNDNPDLKLSVGWLVPGALNSCDCVCGTMPRAKRRSNGPLYTQLTFE